MTKTPNPRKTVNEIHDLQERLKLTSSVFDRRNIKDRLNDLYELRNKQKKQKYTTPKKPNYKKGM